MYILKNKHSKNIEITGLHVGNGRCLPGIMHGLSFILTKGLPILDYTEEYEVKLFSTYIDKLIVMKKVTYKTFPN